MRHRVYGKHLSRDKNQRAALFKGLVSSLFLHGFIETTDTKAKAIKGLVDKVINQAKNKQTRLLSSLLSKQVEEKLVKEIAPALKDRNSGYTSIVKLGRRVGDGAMKVRMSLLADISKGLPQKAPSSHATAKQSQNMENSDKKKPARKVVKK